MWVVALIALLASAFAHPTLDASTALSLEQRQPDAPINCSSIRNFYIRAKGGWRPGNYFELEINGKDPYVGMNANTTSGASVWKINSLGYLTVAVSQSGIAADTLANVYSRDDAGNSFLYLDPAHTQYRSPVSCSIQPEVNGTCPLSCSASVALGKAVYRTPYCFQGVDTFSPDLGGPTPNVTYQKPNEMLAIPAAHLVPP